MEHNFFNKPTFQKRVDILFIPALILAALIGWLVASKGIAIAALLIAIPFGVGFLTLMFLKPRVGFLFFIVYCFAVAGLGKHLEGIQFGLGQDGMLVLTWLGVLFHRGNKIRFRHINNELVWLAFIWFVLTVLEIGNPERPSLLGWFYEMRSTTLYWVLSVPLAFLLLNKKSDIDLFLNIIILISVAGALYGIKQLYLGVDAAENRWLEAGAKKTHLLFGKLRVFSFYAEAGQFGASQAQLAIMCIILATGPYIKSKKIWFGICGFILFYGMLISGTRGALGGLAGGGFIYLVLSKKVKVLILGGMVGAIFLGGLKYTSIGSGSAEVVRLRTSLDPNDPSLMTRLNNQIILKEFLRSRPLGAGVGTIGMWGLKYNQDKFISTIPPDSYFVKIWAMYGIIGFLLWFGIMMYIAGKSAGIIWETRDPVMRNKLISLSAGSFGILVCSYGNEVMNQMPSSIIIYVSWVLIWMSPRWDTPMPKTATLPAEKESSSLASEGTLG